MWKAELHMEGNQVFDFMGADKLSVIRQADVKARNYSGTVTTLRHELPHHNSVIYTDGLGVIGYVNFWEE